MGMDILRALVLPEFCCSASLSGSRILLQILVFLSQKQLMKLIEVLFKVVLIKTSKSYEQQLLANCVFGRANLHVFCPAILQVFMLHWVYTSSTRFSQDSRHLPKHRLALLESSLHDDLHQLGAGKLFIHVSKGLHISETSLLLSKKKQYPASWKSL